MVYNCQESLKIQPENKNNRCLHGMDKESCGYCQGTAKELKHKKLKYKLI